jgi:signal transduction histidine kinase
MLNAGEQVSKSAELLVRSGAAIQALLDDLTDFNRTSLGLGLKVELHEVDLARAVEDELERLRAAYPHRRIELVASGDTRGRWDGSRLQQLLRNLVSNAIKYGIGDEPVRIHLHGERPEVRLEVSNGGRIEASELRQIFEPLKRGAAAAASDDGRQGLGLGLFIVSEIAKAHGGEVAARCDAEQTTFAVRLPRQDAPATS